MAATVQSVTYPYPLPPSIAAALGLTTTVNTPVSNNATTNPPSTTFSDYISSFFGNLSPMELAVLAGGLIYLVMSIDGDNGGSAPHRRRHHA